MILAIRVVLVPNYSGRLRFCFIQLEMAVLTRLCDDVKLQERACYCSDGNTWHTLGPEQ